MYCQELVEASLTLEEKLEQLKLDEESKQSSEPKKEKCGGPIKPRITFFGEALPKKFMDIYASIPQPRGETKPYETCDLLVIIGTSLAVFPFCMVVDFVPDTVPKVLINMENTIGQGYDFEDPYHYPNRLLLKGKCDEVIF